MFWLRTASGIVLLIIAIGGLAFGNIFLWGLMLLCSLVAFSELLRAFKCGVKEKKNGVELLGLGGVLLYYLVLLQSNVWFVLLSIVAVVAAELFLYVFLFPRYQADEVVSSIFSFLYAPVMLSFVYLTRQTQMGIYIVWLILISAWGCDTCAYLVGKAVGKHKIFPLLSPKKSLEGCIGGVLGAALIGGLYAYFWVCPAFEMPALVGIFAFMCGVGALIGMVGDLAASAIKRNHNIKDYGNIIPGHGGIMDRFDSMIMTAPITFLLALLML